MADVDVLEFAQRVLALVDGGRRVSTYKLATLMAIVDCVSLGLLDDDRIRLADLGGRVVDLYWPQVRPSPMTQDRLRQSTQSRAAAVDAVAELRSRATVAGIRTAEQAEVLLAADYVECVGRVSLVLASMPLGKLQRPQGYRSGDDYPRPLYDDRCYPETSASRRAVDNGSMDVRLQPGAAETLVRLSGLLRPLLELQWTRQVAALNRLDREEDDLQRFLFGTDRSALSAVAQPLLELQAGRCFYCEHAIVAGRGQVDHFVPWGRVPENGLANLVLADATCNLDKSDLLADGAALERWRDRDPASLADIATEIRWPLRQRQSLGAARAVYAAVPDGMPLWSGRGRRTLADGALIRQLLRRT